MNGAAYDSARVTALATPPARNDDQRQLLYDFPRIHDIFPLLSIELLLNQWARILTNAPFGTSSVSPKCSRGQCTTHRSHSTRADKLARIDDPFVICQVEGARHDRQMALIFPHSAKVPSKTPGAAHRVQPCPGMDRLSSTGRRLRQSCRADHRLWPPQGEQGPGA